MDDWYVLDGDRRDGPYPMVIMQEMWQAGELAADQLVQQADGGQSRRAGDVAEFASTPVESETDRGVVSGAATSGDAGKSRRRSVMSRVVISLFVTLLVVGVIGIPLLAIVVPLLTNMRETARQNQCQEHLRQLSEGLLKYEAAEGEFPSGWKSQEPLRSNFSWGTSLLPFVNQSGLAGRLRTGDQGLATALTDPSLVMLMESSIPGTICSSETVQGVNQERPVLDKVDGVHQLATSSYLANFGSAGFNSEGNGLFEKDSMFSSLNVVDGESRTILLGERAFWTNGSGAGGQPLVQANGGLWFGLNGDGTTMRQGDVLGTGMGGVNGRRTGLPCDCNVTIGYSSYHPGGVQFAFVDGQVKLLSDGINGEVFNQLLGRNDSVQQVVPQGPNSR
ncbi:MAG: DUF1559 domain-containing protein [Planctomycetaceae bacterium]